MKTVKKLSIFAISAILAAGCTACAGNPPPAGDDGQTPDASGGYQTPVVNTYDNKSYNEYLLGENTTIANQWKGYGIGDPFVMRYNGKYYLYVSSLDSEIGVRGYVSADLVNWAPMTGTGLKEGYVSQDNITLAAYAPEVYYFNGTFYMYTSPGGNGHYILTAKNPEGPFVKATENFGMSIDGSVLIDDDEQAYFTYADGTGIKMARMDDMLSVNAGSTPTLLGTSIGGWTEGPYILKREGIYYLTYTGNHVASDGYRIAYSTATDLSGNYRNAFTRAQNNPLVLETESALKGIGHSSTVMGPDMDSHYLVYHYLNSSGGPNRSLGIDRLTFGGKMMSATASLEKSVTPALPAFYATGKDESKFAQSGDYLLSATDAPAEFTAEYNLKGMNASTYVFGYTGENDYCSVSLDFAAKTVKLFRTQGGTASEIASGTLVNDFSADDLHTVRVAARGGKVDVVFDNMTKIDGAELTVPAGKIGYKSLAQEAEVGYTAYSDVAMGMSDEREAKQSKGYVSANNYLHDDKYAKGSNLSAESALSVIEEDTRIEGWNNLKLGKEKDFASYLVYTAEAGRNALELVYPKADGGKKIGVKIDGVNGGTVVRCTLPQIESDNEYVKAVVGEFDLSEGAHIVRLENVGSAVNFAAFRFIEASEKSPVYEASLSEYAQKGADYKTIWKIKDGGHYAKAGTRQLVYFGDNTLTDFTLEAEMKFEGATGTSTAGFVFHARNYAASSHDSYRSIQAYYLAVNNNQAVLERLGFGDGSSNLDVNVAQRASDEFFKVKIQVRGSNIKVWLGEEENPVLDITDDWPYANGKVGLYTNGAAAVFKNLKISG